MKAKSVSVAVCLLTLFAAALRSEAANFSLMDEEALTVFVRHMFETPNIYLIRDLIFLLDNELYVGTAAWTAFTSMTLAKGTPEGVWVESATKVGSGIGIGMVAAFELAFEDLSRANLVMTMERSGRKYQVLAIAIGHLE